MKNQKRPKKTWGNWSLSRSTYELRYKRGFYCVDLERCRNSAQVLDWIQHVSGKSFVHEDPECMFDLVCALKDLLQLPRGYCESGNSGEVNVDVRSRVDGIDERHEELAKFRDNNARVRKRWEMRYDQLRGSSERG